jgi:small subunit ribosomal protein S13
MALVAGVNIPDDKRVEYSLTRIYGIGPFQAKEVLDRVGVTDNPRVKDLSETDLVRIREIVEREKTVEGDLRREVNLNIRRLIDIGSYRGQRHRRGLPVHGQRTRTNARAKRGPRRPVAGRGQRAKTK